MVPKYIYGILLFGAILFYQLRHQDIVILLALLIISLWGYVGYQHWKQNQDILKTSKESDIEKITTIPTQAYQNKSLPNNVVDLQFLPKKNTRYLQKNPHFIQILSDLRFLQLYDKYRYYDLVFAMDRYQKTYMYMLTRRYRIQDAIQSFYDLYDRILEIMYSYTVSTPVRMRHTYGINPYERIHINIDTFMGIGRTMTDILRNYSEIELNLPHFPEHIPKTYESDRKNVLP